MSESNIKTRANEDIAPRAASGAKESKKGPSLGTFSGVFVPTVLTILGAIMYLRQGWMVGNAGLLGAVLIVLLSHIITIATGLSVSSIATNIRVGAGGAFSIISQSLGLEVGGSIGVPLYLAQSISVALYVLAFTEGWLRLFPGHSEAVVAITAFLVVLIIAMVSTDLAARTQFVILGIVAISLVSIALGSFPREGHEGLVHRPELWGEFSQATFWQTFAIFFPAVTGIMAGISLSGILDNPRRAIPVGTLGGIALTLIVYLVLSLWLACAASPAELLETPTLLVDKAFWGWAVLAGLLGATFSSALGSLVAAPRVVQALAAYGLLPASEWLEKESGAGEPINALLVTGSLSGSTLILALLSGGLDVVAPLITMFFLLTYAMLNAVVFIEQTLAMVSFRPTFGIPRIIPLIGFISCVAVMFSVNAGFSLVALVMTLAIYGYLLQLEVPMIATGDVRSGLFLSIANWAAQKVTEIPAAPERTWQPNILAPIQNPEELISSYRLLRSMTQQKGAIHILALYTTERKQFVELDMYARDLGRDGIYARVTKLEQANFNHGAAAAMELLEATFFRPNLLFLPFNESHSDIDFQRLAQKARSQRMGMVLLSRDPVLSFGREKLIQVWIRDQAPDWSLSLRLSNLDLALLLAYQLACSWEGRVELCMAVSNEDHMEAAEQFLGDLIRLSRLSQLASFKVFNQSFNEALEKVHHPDLTILGLPSKFDHQSIGRLVGATKGATILVRDSGDESVLA